MNSLLRKQKREKLMKVCDKMNDFCDDITPYKKKKKQKSKSNKRSDHKHNYEKVIMKSVIGWMWARKCKICGRLDYKLAVSAQEFQRPECRQLPYSNRQCYYTYEELKELYPEIKIIEHSPWELN